MFNYKSLDSLRFTFVKHINLEIMGHINLSIQQDQLTKWYILSSAEYLEEAWLAEVNENESTKIVKQFKCKKFKSCFRELRDFVAQLGEVKKISGSDIREQDMRQLEHLLFSKSDRVLPINEPEKERKVHFWNWLKNDHYMNL